MSYKTNAKALRLGISHDWSYKSQGPLPRLHLDHKLTQYITNLVEHIVPQAPQRAKTKGRFLGKFSSSPGIQGQTQVLRGGDQMFLFIRFYLNLNGASEQQKRRFDRNIQLICHQLGREGGGLEVRVRCFNVFHLFWRMRLFTGRRVHRRLKARVREAARQSPELGRERVCYSAIVNRVRRLRRAMSRWRRQRYFTRSFNPIVGAFLLNEFDADLAARAIALELQILRIHHKRFMRYVRRLLWLCFHHLHGPPRLLEGLRMEVRGRMTDHRRQVRRAQTKTTRFGLLKKSSLRVEGGHCRYLAYNRYGVISVSFTYQLRSLEAEQWEDRVAQSPLRAFNLLEPLEIWADGGDHPLDPAITLRHPTYTADPTGLLDNRSHLERLRQRRAEGEELLPGEVLDLENQPQLEELNRYWILPHRLHLRGLHLRRPLRHRLLLRPRRFSTPDAFSNASYFLPRRGMLAPFQLQLRRQQQLRIRLRSGHDRRLRSGRGPAVDPSLYHRWRLEYPSTQYPSGDRVPAHRVVPQPLPHLRRQRLPWRRLGRRSPTASLRFPW